MIREIYYVDGLVSSGKQFPFTILKRISSFEKKITINFMHNLNFACGKAIMFDTKCKL